jgi:thiol:disulfide interchange protein DsbD
MKQIATTIFLLGMFLLTFGTAKAQVLDPVKWTTSVEKVSEQEVFLVFKAKLEKPWHMYAQNFDDGGPLKMVWTLKENKDFKKIGSVQEITKPHKERDVVFDVNVAFWSTDVVLKQKIKILSEKKFKIQAEVKYQCCTDEQCVNFTKYFPFEIEGVKQTTTETQPETEPSKDTLVGELNAQDTAIVQVDETTEKTDTFAAITPISNASGEIDLSGDSLLWLFWISFIAGLLAILTPCVFPMIPMTVSFFMKEGDQKNKGRFQALFYGLSIILIYTVIGTLVAVLFGVSFANWLSTHWLPNVLFFIIFVFFAASFLGMFEITLPNWLINKSDSQADKGGVMAPFFMAFTLVLVSFSCTGPLVGAILVKSAGGAVIEPIVGMLGFSLAFALPFTLFAFFPSWLTNLPKSGGWLNSVKVVLGFIELALGLKFLSVADQTYHWGILDREIYLAIWIVLAILLGMYLLGKLKFSHDSDLAYISVPRLGLAIVVFSFAVYLVPGMWGAPLKALSGYLPPMSSHDFDVNKIVMQNGNQNLKHDALPEKPKYANFLHLPHGLQGYFDYEQGMRVAKQLNKPVFIDFTGHGCVNCREMEANVWANPRVLHMLANDYLVIAVYVDDKTQLPENEWIKSTFDGRQKKTIGDKNADLQITKYNVNAQPYYVLLDNEENLLVQPRAYNLNVDEFVEFLENGLKAYQNRNEK